MSEPDPFQRTTLALGVFAGVAQACTQAEFEQRFPYSFLLIKLVEKRKPKHTRWIVSPIVTRYEVERFGALVTVGRAENNDIVISHAGVSKLHGYFKTRPDGELEYTDAESSSGTFVDGEKLVPEQARVVRSGAEIYFSAVETTLCSAGLLYERARNYK